jgi:hypothetical protein
VPGDEGPHLRGRDAVTQIAEATAEPSHDHECGAEAAEQHRAQHRKPVLQEFTHPVPS